MNNYSKTIVTAKIINKGYIRNTLNFDEILDYRMEDIKKLISECDFSDNKQVYSTLKQIQEIVED